MKHFDDILKYLSGELSPEESNLFEKELAGNPQLKEEFTRVSFAYNMIGDQLKQRDDEAFASALKTAMEKTREASPWTRKTGRHWFMLLGVAASLAIVFSIFRPGPDSEKIYDHWFNPSEDELISTLMEETRSEAGTNVARLWKEGDYENCRKLCREKLSEDPDNQYTMLFCLLSFLETENAESPPPWLSTIDNNSQTPLEQALIWYHSLALVKEGHEAEAVDLLITLEGLPGPYSKDAHKLKKMLTK